MKKQPSKPTQASSNPSSCENEGSSLGQKELREQNLLYAETDGVSSNNQGKGFCAAFRDEESGRIEYAKFKDGRQAAMHLICGLPLEWAAEFDSDGNPSVLKPTIVAGFCRDGEFFTREQTIQACQS